MHIIRINAENGPCKRSLLLVQFISGKRISIQAHAKTQIRAQKTEITFQESSITKMRKSDPFHFSSFMFDSELGARDWGTKNTRRKVRNWFPYIFLIYVSFRWDQMKPLVICNRDSCLLIVEVLLIYGDFGEVQFQIGDFRLINFVGEFGWLGGWGTMYFFF